MGSWGAIETAGPADWLAMASRSSHVAVGISRLDSGVIVEVNEAFCRLFQYRHDELVGRTSSELGLWLDVQQRPRLLELAQRPDGITRFEAGYRNRGGDTGLVDVSARVVAQDGERFLVVFMTDITSQREVVEGLRTAQSRLSVLLRASGVLVFRQDAELRYTWVANPALGATEEDLLGRSDEEIMGTEAAQPLLTIKRRVLATGVAERRDLWVANNGQLGCFDLIVEPERDASGRVTGILCAAQDITARMTGPQAPLQRPLKTIQGMAALIGHEALTPRQSERLGRIGSEVARLAGPASARPALQELQERHAGTMVLVAEHNPVLGELVRALLETAGLRVASAGSGVEAFSFALQLSPALLLLDMELPQNGAVAAARALRAMLPKRLPIVAMLSPRRPPGAAPELDADLDDLLEKPVSAARLYDIVLTWLDAR